MEQFQSTLETDICEELPTLSAEQKQQLLRRLLELAKHPADLPHLEPSDLQPPLRKTSAKHFVSFFQHRYGRCKRPPSQNPEIQEDGVRNDDKVKFHELKEQGADSSTENINHQRKSASFPKRRQALKKRSFDRAISVPTSPPSDTLVDDPTEELILSDIVKIGKDQPISAGTLRPNSNGEDRVKAGPIDEIPKLSRSKFEAVEGSNDRSECSVQPTLDHKNLPLEGSMSVEQKCSECDSHEADALMRSAEALMSGSSQRWTMPLQSLPPDRQDLGSDGDQSFAEREKDKKKNKIGMLDKLRKFTFGLLSSEKPTVEDCEPLDDATVYGTEKIPDMMKEVQPYGPSVSRDMEGIMLGKQSIETHAKTRHVHFAEVYDSSQCRQQPTWQRATINQRQFIRRCSRRTEMDGPTLQHVDSFWDSDDCHSINSESLSEDSGEEEEEQEVCPLLEAPSPTAVKLKCTALELFTTEEAYVQRLHLLDQVFHLSIVHENQKHHMFPDDVIPQMFSNITSIYQFHNDFLLPEIEQRMSDWNKTPKIGDLMSKYAPFLKLYTEYVTNLERAIKTISQWQQGSKKFAEVLVELEKRPECERLLLQQHMAEPLQRLPRYELLLKKYLLHLPEDSDDRQDTERALELVASAAAHANQTLRKNEEFYKLLELNTKLHDVVDLSEPSRELVKEGKIFKLSPTNGALSFRYLFLFSDRLLVCTEYRLCSFTTYRIDTVLNADSMQVVQGDNLEVHFTFYVKTRSKTVELHCRSHEEMQSWLSAIQRVLAEYKKRLMTRLPELTSAEDDKLGVCAPTWVKDQDTSMCMLCATHFSSIRRRHHCRCCGIVVCGECSSWKAALAYVDNKPSRVCDVCYEALKLQDDELGIIGVKGSDPSVASGMMLMSSDKKIWERRWFALNENFNLYSFKAPQDIEAMTSTYLPGYRVTEATEEDQIDKQRVIKISHPDDITLVCYLHIDNPESRTRWLIALQCAANVELPPDYCTVREKSDNQSSNSQTTPKCLMFET